MKNIRVKKIGYIAVILSVLIAGSVFPVACGSTAATLQQAMVQVWQPAAGSGEPDSFLATGVVVGDGRQVLTVLNYEDYTPGDLKVVLPGRGEFEARIRVIDPRTGATLLQLEDAELPAMVIDATESTVAGQEVTVWGWSSDLATIEEVLGTVSAFNFSSYPFTFRVELPDSGLGLGWVPRDGAVVTDENNNILGLAGTYYSLPQILLPVQPPPVVTIASALELLASDVESQTWVRGPALSVIATEEGVTGFFAANAPVDYDRMTVALEELLGKMGTPLAPEELPDYYLGYNYSVEGVLLTVLYPAPVDLKGSGGELLARAKWVGIQWGDSEDGSARLFYGSEAYTVDGGYVLDGDISVLKEVIR